MEMSLFADELYSWWVSGGEEKAGKTIPGIGSKHTQAAIWTL